ncbi:TerB family tellurite resistance protein [Bacteroidota bacterium]
MSKYGKWIGGGLGWAFLGPLGGFLGFALGSMFDNNDGQNIRRPGATTRGDFAMSLIVLVGAVMKADGKVVQSELEYVKKYFVQSFGYETSQEVIPMLKDIIKQDIAINDICQQISHYLDYSSRLQLLHLLFGISLADGHTHSKEVKVIENISNQLGIDFKDFSSIKSMFVTDIDSSYKILEVDSSASDEEVKKAYRKMAVKYHPDKVSYLGEDFREKAKEKFQKLNEAFTKIKKERGMAA